MLSAHSRLNASAEVLRGEQFIQVDGDVRKGERVIFAADATAKIAQQLVVDLRKAVFVNEFMPGQAFDPEERREDVLEHLHSRLEPFEDLVNDAGTAVTVAPFEHPPLYLFLRLNRRKIREREEVIALEVSAFLHELLATFIIDHPRHCMRERTLLRVAGGSGADQVRVQHPTAAEAEDGIQPGSQSMHFSMRG